MFDVHVYLQVLFEQNFDLCFSHVIKSCRSSQQELFFKEDILKVTTKSMKNLLQSSVSWNFTRCSGLVKMKSFMGVFQRFCWDFEYVG